MTQRSDDTLFLDQIVKYGDPGILLRYSLVSMTVQKRDRTFVESEAERHVSFVGGGYKCKL